MTRGMGLVFPALLILLAPAGLAAQQPAQPQAAQGQAAAPAPAPPHEGKISSSDRQRALSILEDVSKIVQSNYYDPKMNGVDWNANIASARAKIIASDSINEALGYVAVAVGALNDSHTVFIPPTHPVKVDYGLDYEMIWSRCFITHVRPGSDAQAKGLSPGDEILSFNGFTPSRENLWAINYLYNTLRPQPGFRLEVQTPSGEKRQVDAMAKVTPLADLAYRPGASVRYDLYRQDEDLEHLNRIQWVMMGDIGIIKFPWFFYDPDQLAYLSQKIKKLSGVVIDLRGDPGGSVDTLKYFAGMFFDHDVKLADEVTRKKTEPITIKSQHHLVYNGKVIVLVDSKSASAAELFARLMQIEKRGIVMGDRSSGSVMESNDIWYSSMGVDYDVQVTVADLIMTDGKSLEHRGVSPDIYAIPHPDDLAAGRDPVLAKAVAQLGVALTPDEAGKIFPYEWPKD